MFNLARHTIVCTVALLGVAGCAQPTEQTETATHDAQEPGYSSCQFDQAPDHVWDEDDEYGTPETAEIRETDDAYHVTMTGDLLDPETVVTDNSRITFSLRLFTADGGDGVDMATQWDGGELAFSNVYANAEMTNLDTEPIISAGSFTVVYPKDFPALSGLEPIQWSPTVTFDPAVGDTSVNSVEFTCDNGQHLLWEPLGETHRP